MYKPNPHFILTDKDKQIAWAQAMNLAVALLAPKATPDSIGTEAEIRRWQEWFYNELTEPYRALENKKNEKSRKIELEEKHFEVRDEFEEESKGEKIININEE